MSAVCAASLGELRRELGVVCASIVTVRAKRKAAEAAERRRRLAVAGAWRLTGVERRTALAIYTLSSFDADAAAEYLDRRGVRHSWPQRTKTELREVVETIFLDATMDEILEVVDKDTVSGRAAEQFVEERRLYMWCKERNEVCGAAPSTDDVLVERERLRAAGTNVGAVGLGSVADARARMWATRWRRRWGGRFSQIREADCVSAEEIHRKARRPSVGLPLDLGAGTCGRAGERVGYCVHV